MAAGPDIIGMLVFLIVLLLGGGSLIAGIVLLIIHYARRSSAGADGMTCGKCGYMVRGLSTLACPECGSDLREVGIRPPVRTRPTLAWVLLTFGVLFNLTCVCGGLWAMQSRVSSSPPTLTPTPSPSSTP